MRTTVTAEPVVNLWLPRFGMTPVKCRLQYHPADPYAVTLTLDHGDGRTTTWTFARSLLADGVNDKAGDGDVRIWRVTSSNVPTVALALTSARALVHLYADLGAMSDFVTATYTSVPPGAEPGFVDLDGAIAALLRDDD
jgi:hypothetical protein